MPFGQWGAGTLRRHWPGRKRPGRTKGALCSLGSGTLWTQRRHGPAGNGQEGPRGHYALWAVGRWDPVQTRPETARGTKGTPCPLGSGALWLDPAQTWPGRKRPGRTKGALCSLGSGTLESGADMARPETARENQGGTMPLGYKSAGAQCRHGSAECSPRKPRGHFALWAPERRVYLSKSKEPLQKRPRFTVPFAVENLYDIFHLPARNAAFDSKT